jgi:hypothetical protein
MRLASSASCGELCGASEQRHQGVTLTLAAVFPCNLQPLQKELYAATFERAGAASSLINGRLAVAEFKLLAVSVPYAAATVWQRVHDVEEQATMMLVANGTGRDQPGLVLRSSRWSGELPDPSVLGAEGTWFAKAAMDWSVA